MKKLFILNTVLLFFIVNNIVYTQFNSDNFSFPVNKNNSFYKADKSETSNATLPLVIGTLSFLYLFNPIVLFQNDKIAGGLTKEFSVGFGDFGENRISIDYSYLFISDKKSTVRAGLKHDFLLKTGIKPSNMLQGTSVISLGAGYYTNFTNTGYFPEISYGYSIRNFKLLFYPNLKVRYTFVVNGSDVLDFSTGITIGIANPFIESKIRNKKQY